MGERVNKKEIKIVFVKISYGKQREEKYRGKFGIYHNGLYILD